MGRREIQAGKAVIVVELADKTTRQFNQIAMKLNNGARVFRDLSTNALGGALGTGLVTKQMLSNFTEFEDVMLNLAAKLGYFGIQTKEQKATLAELEKQIIDLGRSSSYTSKEVAQGAVSLAQAGFTAKEIGGSLQAVLDLSRGTGLAIGEAGDILANTVRNFKIFGANDTYEQRMIKATDVSSKFVKAARMGTIELSDLRESLRYVGGKSNDLGVSLETTLGFLVQMSEAGLKGSLAGTSLNTMMSNLTANLDKIQKQFPTFVIQLNSLGKVDLVATVQELLRLTDSMNFLDKTTFFQEVFNIRGARAFAASMDINKIKKYIEEIHKAAAESRLAAQLMESGSGGAFRRLTSGIEAFYITLTKEASPALNVFMDTITESIHRVEKFFLANKYLIFGLLLTPPAFAAMGLGALTLSFTLSKLSLVMRGLYAASKPLRAFGSFLGGSLLSVGKSLTNSPVKRQAALVASLQKGIDAKLARGADPAKLAKSASMKKLISASLKLKQLQKGTLFGMVKSSIGSVGSGIGRAIGGTFSRIKEFQAIRESNKEIRSQIKLEGILIGKKRERALAEIKAIKPLKTSALARELKAIQLEGQAQTMTAKRAVMTQRLGKEQRRLQSLQSVHAKAFPAREKVIQDAYDQLYYVRNQMKTAPQGSMTRDYLLKREASLSKVINTNQAKQAATAGKIARSQRNIGIYNKAIATTDKAISTTTARAARVRAQIPLAQKIEAQLQARKLGIANRLATAEKLSQARTMRATMNLKNPFTAFKGIGSGFSMLKGGLNLGSFAKAGTSLLSLAAGFGRLAMSMGRFVFSWNFVGLVFNALLLFGDKIPVIANAFTALGQGFAGAFGEIGKIAQYAGPALKLFQLSFEAFLQGDTSTGIAALSAGFSGIVEIIQNQLAAAWDRFMEKVGYIFTFFEQIYKSIETIIKSLVSGISSAVGFVAGPVFRSFGDIFNSLSSGNGGGLVEGIVTAVDSFITAFFQAVIRVQQVFDSFLFKLAETLGGIIALLPGGKSAGENILAQAKNDKTTRDMEASIAIGKLEYERKQREKELKATLGQDTGYNAIQRGKSADARNYANTEIMFSLEKTFEKIQGTLERNVAERDRQIQSLQQQTSGSQEPQSRYMSNDNPEDVPTKLTRHVKRMIQAITGSVSSTRGLLKIDTETLQEIQQEQLDVLERIDKTLSINGGVR